MSDEPQGQVPAVSGPEPAPAPPVGAGDTPPAPAHEPETANAEAARYRTQLRAAERRLAQLEADAKARQDADLSELQKAQNRLKDLETAQTAAAARARAAELKAAGLALGGKLGVPADRLGLLVKLLQVDGGEVEFDEDGSPARDSLERVLKSILRENPVLVAAPAAPAPAAPAPLASGAPTNPPRETRAQPYSREQLAAMSPEQYAQERAQILQSYGLTGPS